jgi:hypothetical protein
MKNCNASLTTSPEQKRGGKTSANADIIQEIVAYSAESNTVK